MAENVLPDDIAKALYALRDDVRKATDIAAPTLHPTTISQMLYACAFQLDVDTSNLLLAIRNLTATTAQITQQALAECSMIAPTEDQQEATSEADEVEPTTDGKPVLLN